VCAPRLRAPFLSSPLLAVGGKQESQPILRWPSHDAAPAMGPGELMNPLDLDQVVSLEQAENACISSESEKDSCLIRVNAAFDIANSGPDGL
jgi:hypothetical protein